MFVLSHTCRPGSVPSHGFKDRADLGELPVPELGVLGKRFGDLGKRFGDTGTTLGSSFRFVPVRGRGIRGEAGVSKIPKEEAPGYLVPLGQGQVKNL
eukprot:gene3625-biopygen12132